MENFLEILVVEKNMEKLFCGCLGFLFGVYLSLFEKEFYFFLGILIE